MKTKSENTEWMLGMYESDGRREDKWGRGRKS